MHERRPCSTVRSTARRGWHRRCRTATTGATVRYNKPIFRHSSSRNTCIYRQKHFWPWFALAVHNRSARVKVSASHAQVVRTRRHTCVDSGTSGADSETFGLDTCTVDTIDTTSWLSAAATNQWKLDLPCRHQHTRLCVLAATAQHITACCITT